MCLVSSVWVVALLLASQSLRAERLRRQRDFGDPAVRQPFVPPPLPPPFVLLTTFFSPRNSHERAAELEAVLLANVQNGFFDEVHLLVSPEDVSALPHAMLRNHPEVSVTLTSPGKLSGLPERLTANARGSRDRSNTALLVSDFFAFANARLSGRLVLLANADIEFDSSVSRLRTEGEIARGNLHAGYAVSRINPPCPGRAVCTLDPWCRESLCNEDFAWYDALGFVPPIPQAVVNGTNYRQNLPGVDNVVVHLLGDPLIGGLFMTNPCEDVRLIHRHCFYNASEIVARKPETVDGVPTYTSCQHYPLTPSPNSFV